MRIHEPSASYVEGNGWTFIRFNEFDLRWQNKPKLLLKTIQSEFNVGLEEGEGTELLTEHGGGCCM